MLAGLGPEYSQFETSISVLPTFSTFQELIPLLVNEESKLATKLSSSKTEQVLYAGRGRGRGRFSRGGYNSGCFGQQGRGQSPSTNNTTQPQQQQGNARGRGSYRGRGGFQGRGGSQIVCNYCGIRGHIARDCFKKQKDIRSGVLPQSNYVTIEQPQHSDHLFSMSHVMGSMSTASTEEEWYINFGASNHMTAHEEWFTNMEPIKQPGVVIAGDDTSHPITYMGKIPVQVQPDSVQTIKDVLCVPGIKKNLIFVGQMVEQDLQVRFNKAVCFIEDMNCNMEIVAQGTKVGRMFRFNATIPETQNVMYGQQSSEISELEMWHKRVGHMNFQRLKDLHSSDLVRGLPHFSEHSPPRVCVACQFGKQSRQPFNNTGIRASKVLELIHTDLWTSSTRSLGGCLYCVSFIDDFSRKTWVYFLKAKLDALKALKDFKNQAEKQIGKYILKLRSNGGEEYLSEEFDTFLIDQGIKRQVTCPYTPQQNGVAEWKNRHILEVARAMLNEKHMPKCYWAEAVACAICLMNRTPTAAVHDKTPKDAFT
ncbi:hypothetical protein Mp_1g06970 [Marchantia polymorpha subsp. ruderalis]|uniref:Integrase catalytic domain-containing protein n=1 Tax=Marchantia polymorpha subsp. ruderalis TaxID=1480154 RepID=A0AAF6AMD7_MARPO|nr:hypothetical protein Mp_1g06970 [Marchantia polymorpha subsp. ruderalis]